MTAELLAEKEELLPLKGSIVQTILVVDDDPLVLKALEESIKEDFDDVLAAASGEEAIEILRREEIALLLCDLKMEGIGGKEVILEAKRLQPDAVRMIITGNSSEESAIEAINLCQVSQFIVKPWDDNQLRHAVHSGVEQYHLIHKNRELQEMLLSKHRALTLSHSDLKKNLQLAAMIQETLLHGDIPKEIFGFAIDATTIASQEIDGDFYDFYQPAKGTFDVVIGDVMGKGIPAAVIGTAVKSQLMRYAAPVSEVKLFDEVGQWRDDLLTPWQIVSKVQGEIASKLIRLQYFVCLFYGRFDMQKRSFSFVDCGSAKPIHYMRGEGKALQLKGENFPLGVIEKEQFKPHATRYERGDFFVFYSDGLTESRSTGGELYGIERLTQLIERESERSATELMQRIKNSVMEFSGKSSFDDDLTLIVIKIEKEFSERDEERFFAKFSSCLSQLKAVRDFIAKVCKALPGENEPMTSQLQLAINEAFCNIIKHGYGDKRGGEIKLEALLGSKGMTLVLSDQGASFDPSEVVEPSLAGDRENGFGWHIIRSISDQIAYVKKRADDGWNHLRIYKHYHHGESKMELSHQQKKNVLVIEIISESLDAKDAAEFKQKVIDLINSNDSREVVFNLQKLKFIDSSGLGSFLAVLRNLNSQGGDLKLSNMSNTVRTMFELVSMHKIFEIHSSVDEALRSFEREKVHNSGNY